MQAIIGESGGRNMARFTRLLVWILAGTCIVQPSFGQTQSDHQAVRSVRDWYKAFEGSAGVRAQYGGFVGGRFDGAYALLSAALKAKMPNVAFEELYAEVAHMKLLQAHLVWVDERAGAIEVFVEEERTIVARTGVNEQVPAMAWYTGTLKLERNSAGIWRIDSMAVLPEDVISMQYGGHSPWRSDLQAVAQVAAGAYRNRECPVATPSPPASRSIDINWTITCVDDGSKYTVHEVRLHSGEWHVLQVSPGR
jgi:hypothetical protein